MHVPGLVVVGAILSSRNALRVFEWMIGRDTHSFNQEGTVISCLRRKWQCSDCVIEGLSLTG